jgi:hypothetical protein
MEESFILKFYGGFSLEEQSFLTAEDRKFYYDRTIDEIKKQNESGKSQSNQIGFGGANFS